MTDFERGLRFALEHEEHYTRGQGDDVTQFGEYQMHLKHRPASSYADKSAAHLEKRIKAYLCLAGRLTP